MLLPGIKYGRFVLGKRVDGVWKRQTMKRSGLCVCNRLKKTDVTILVQAAITSYALHADLSVYIPFGGVDVK